MPTYNADNYLITEAVNPIGSNTRQVTFKYTIGAVFADNDILRLFKIPKGATLTQLVVKLPDLDSGTTVVIDFGVEGDTTTMASFLDGSTTGRTGGDVVLYPFYTATNEIAATMYVEAGPTTATSGTIFGFAVFDFYPKY